MLDEHVHVAPALTFGKSECDLNLHVDYERVVLHPVVEQELVDLNDHPLHFSLA